MKKRICLIISILILGCSEKHQKKDLALIPVRSGDYWGYINNEGKLVINPQFKLCYAFNNGYALIQNSDNKFGYIDKDGKYVVNPIYKNACGFSDDLALVVKDSSQLEYIGKDGKNVLTLSAQIDEANSFSEGLASVKSNNLYGYIDKTGKVAIPCKFNYAGPFNDGLALVSTQDRLSRAKFGYINKAGEQIIPCQFDFAGNFNDGLAVVQSGNQFGYIDNKGNYSINPQFVSASNFSDGYASIQQGSLYGFIDKGGKIVINPQFKYLDAFSDNDLAVVESTDGKFGYINKKGEYVINPQFDNSSSFYGKIAFIKISNKLGLIDESGKIIVNPQFDEVCVSEDNGSAIQSEYLDVNQIVESITKGTTKDGFFAINSNSTYADLTQRFPGLNESNINNVSLGNVISNQYIENPFINLNFNNLRSFTNVTTNQQVYDAASGGYVQKSIVTGTQSLLNLKSQVATATFNYYLKGLAYTRRNDILNKIYFKLKSLYAVGDGEMSDSTGGGIRRTLKTNDFVIDFDDTNGNQLIISVIFNIANTNNLTQADGNG